MQVEVLVEEESAAAALRHLLPRLLPGRQYRLRVFEGCRDLLEQLPRLLPAYQRRMQQPGQEGLRVVVLLDADGVGEKRLATLEGYAADAGLRTWQPEAILKPFQLLNCLAIQELEAWFLGDPAAVQAAYPRVHPHHFKGLSANPDDIADAWETLRLVLQRANVFAQGKGKAKVEWASTIAPHLDPARNISASFQYFCRALQALG